MSQSIQLIVGLNNPGAEYEATRHNAGAWFVKLFADNLSASFTSEKKFFGDVSKVIVNGKPVWLLLPNTFMNRSGRSAKALADYYKIAPENILLVHDELDLPAGQIKLKYNGGHAGHNGLRDIFQQFGSQNFYRLRIGIGHPGNQKAVHDYVLGSPSKLDREAIDSAITQAEILLPEFITGDKEKVIKALHT